MSQAGFHGVFLYLVSPLGAEGIEEVRRALTAVGAL